MALKGHKAAAAAATAGPKPIQKRPKERESGFAARQLNGQSEPAEGMGNLVPQGKEKR